jgi:hypothetical protein
MGFRLAMFGASARKQIGTLNSEGAVYPSQTIDDLELALIDLEFATADFVAKKSSITKPNQLDALLTKLTTANRAAELAMAALAEKLPERVA